MSNLFSVLAMGSVLALGGCTLRAQEESGPTGKEPLLDEEVVPGGCVFEETVTASSGLNCRTCASVDCDVVLAYPYGTVLCGMSTTSGDCILGYAGWDLTDDGCWVASVYTDWPTEPC